MKVKLVFDTWLAGPTGECIYQTPIGVALTMGQFHSGTTFNGNMDLDEENAAELERSIKNGYIPVFKVCMP